MGCPLLLLLALLTAVTKAKVFSRCELARLLQEEGLNGYGGYSLANWLCMAFYESTFNTAAQSIKVDGSADYGIFQISSQQWCTDDHSPSDNRCRMACRDLLSSNITDDIICAKRIVRNPQGMDAWEGWAMHCKGRDSSEWVEGCDL
ncbi:lysozyme C, milk isozyme-like [Spheniscus humboldti]